jgi:hypothetical protein
MDDPTKAEGPDNGILPGKAPWPKPAEPTTSILLRPVDFCRYAAIGSGALAPVMKATASDIV